MTNREFYSLIKEGTINAEVQAFASAEIEKLDNRNEKRRNTPTKEQVANEALKVELLKVLTRPMVAKELADALGVSTQKVSALAKQLVNEGKLIANDYKVKGKGTVKQYAQAE